MQPSEQRIPMLYYDQQSQCWHGETTEISIWLSDARFQKYVNAWLETQGITKPTEKQIYEAFGHCRALSYWKDCCDPEVHITNPEKLAQTQA